MKHIPDMTSCFRDAAAKKDTRRRPAVFLQAGIVLLTLTLLGVSVLACDVAMRPTAVPSLAPPSTTSTSSPKPHPTTTPTPAPPTPTPRPTPGGAFSCNVVPQETITATEPLQHVVLFARQVTSSESFVSYESSQQLWGISADGRRLGRVSAAREGIAVYAPPAGPPELVLLMTSPLLVADESIRVLELPQECRRPPGLQYEWQWQPCSDFEFSSDGQRAVFLWGWDDCSGRQGAMVLDLATGKVWPWPDVGVIGIRFLRNGRVLVTNMDCEGGQHMSVWDPESGVRRAMGGGYDIRWNSAESAVAAWWVSPYWGFMGDDSVDSAVWVYNVTTDRSAGSGEGDNNNPCWSPDESGLLYQHRALTFTESTYPATFAYTVTFGPREVRRINVDTMQNVPLAADVRYDYHTDCSTWKGEWVAVLRMPYEPRTCTDRGCDPCVYGPTEGCPPAEYLALNARTGELRSWGDPSLPPLQPTPTPYRPAPTPSAVPWPNLQAPVYTDPAGRYALYVGMDGRSLWCMQAGQAPVEWIGDGDLFFYVP